MSDTMHTNLLWIATGAVLTLAAPILIILFSTSEPPPVVEGEVFISSDARHRLFVPTSRKYRGR